MKRPLKYFCFRNSTFKINTNSTNAFPGYQHNKPKLQWVGFYSHTKWDKHLKAFHDEKNDPKKVHGMVAPYAILSFDL